MKTDSKLCCIHVQKWQYGKKSNCAFLLMDLHCVKAPLVGRGSLKLFGWTVNVSVLLGLDGFQSGSVKNGFRQDFGSIFFLRFGF